MKLVFIIPSFRGGGAERAAITIADELNKLEDFEVVLISISDEGPLRDLASNLRVIDLYKDRARQAIFALRSKLLELRPDVVFSVLPQTNILHWIVDKTTSGQWKSVCMLQNYYEKIIEQENVVTSSLFKQALEAADAVVPNSKQMAENLISATRIEPDNVHPIYNPIDIDRVIEMSKEEVTEEVFSHSPVLLGVGRLEKQKGFRYFIEALPKIKKEYPDAQIVLLGKGSLEDQLKEQARELGVEESVHFLGFVDNPYKYMRAADVFVLSSLWEGLPTVLIEAMATGTPVVSTDCPSGPQEILTKEKSRSLVPAGDSNAIAMAVGRALRNDLTSKEVRIERACTFSPNVIVQKFSNFLLKYDK